MTKTMPKTDKTSSMALFFKDNIKKYLSPDIERKTGKAMLQLFHYTKLSTLFDILESDSLWLSGLRFSNDSSEEILLGKDWLKKAKYSGDNFIFCVGDNRDSLSQWRGYCSNGGVSIGFDFSQRQKFSVLYSDYEKSKKHEDVYALALPVLYAPERDANENGPKEAALLIMRKIEAKLPTDNSLTVNDFVPFIKHHAFHEERERRLLLSNTNGELSKCICFRCLPNGTKLPYIVIKSGCLDESHEYIKETSNDNIKKIILNRALPNWVIVPECTNQNELCNLTREYIKEHPELFKGMNIENVRVFCEGHLPIRSITIAPMPDQNRIKEQIVRFCQSKYWLQNVKVDVSSIPYVTSINS